jgi:solute:Na+ symporter, SSS family
MTHRLDFILFAVYLAANIALGLWVARRKTGDARGYFLAGDRLPWYAIGGSIIAANISTEHFIGMVGIAYAVGFVVAQWEWGNWFTFSVLIWIFLPYFIRGGLYTMPEFLERRYNSTCRLPLFVRGLFAGAVDRGADGRGDAGGGQSDEGDVRH